MDPHCPGSLLSWIHIVLDPLCPGSILSWIHLVPGSLLSLWPPIVLMDPYCLFGSLLSFSFPTVPMDPYCPAGSILSWIHIVLFVLVPFCPGSILSWIHFVLDPFCPGSFLSCLVRSERSALTRKYRARTWAMEWHWQRTTFPANGTKNGKNIGPKIAKNTKIKDFGSRLVQTYNMTTSSELICTTSR